MKRVARIGTAVFLLLPLLILAQDKQDKTGAKDPLDPSVFSGLKWRNIGPAFCSGRIADFAVNPANPSEYYTAVASGHIWKTVNSGTTFEPVFDSYGAYAIGCLALDPNNPHVVWAGTGENNHQRALGYGDGVYKTEDGGKSWKNMGLKNSRQVGRIVVDPRDSDVVFVAAEGSVWGPGGERGLYKTVDGGRTWRRVLHISDDTGVNNLVFDPRDPDRMYATSEQRRRHVHTKIGGGPESAVYKSTDGGESWQKAVSGLPTVDIGGMGLDISPANPDVLYLIVEAAEGKSGFYRSRNRAAAWERMSDHASSGQYYNEIFCDPRDVDKVYSVETVSHVTEDAGRTWRPVGNDNRHVDDHALWIDPADTAHVLIGGDGGIYETFDGGKTWDFKENLPVTQFYRVFADNRLPFYHVYGGTQDNNSLGAPSRTISADGIVNDDWVVTNGGDGFWSAVDPSNPDIVYAESQYGGMVRYDLKSGEALSIRPEPGPGEKTFRWNWDTPLIQSRHNPGRLYCAAERVFRSDDRGESWTAVSGDLTAGIDRNTWPVMGKFWSVDAVAKDLSTSLFGTIVSLAESPLDENLLYAGTDDGLIQVTEDGGRSWRKVSGFPGVPEHTYVSDILPSRFESGVVYASFNNTLRDDFKPYILKSADRGRTWTPVASGLPAEGAVHSLEQDFVKADLLFAGTEFSFFFSPDGGRKWVKLASGLPPIPVRDIALQERESDIVIATFGRGLYILDDYSSLRAAGPGLLASEAHLFPVRDALMYVLSGARYGQGTNYFKAPNPEFGACFTFYLKDVPKTLLELRKEREKPLFKDGKPIPQPTDEELLAERREVAPYLVFTVTDEEGREVRRLTRAAARGIQRLHWDLRAHDPSPVAARQRFDPLAAAPSGTLAMPGTYNVSLALVTRDGIKELAGPVAFNAVALRNTTLPAADRAALVAFQKEAAGLARSVRGAYDFLRELQTRVTTLRQALLQTPAAPLSLLRRAEEISLALEELGYQFQ
ncbi:MAG: glycosyl hydrolase, partial [Candidatus Aminicenantes bacterium]|nr:glycosyl hydrolase [Candidatus Aminicenantes bacterium]